jgi:hypothetical protein
MKKRERKKIQECMKTEGEGKKYVKEIRWERKNKQKEWYKNWKKEYREKFCRR